MYHLYTSWILWYWLSPSVFHWLWRLISCGCLDKFSCVVIVKRFCYTAFPFFGSVTGIFLMSFNEQGSVTTSFEQHRKAFRVECLSWISLAFWSVTPCFPLPALPLTHAFLAHCLTRCGEHVLKPPHYIFLLIKISNIMHLDRYRTDSRILYTLQYFAYPTMISVIHLQM